MMLTLAVGGGSMVYLMLPRWPGPVVALDAPAIPITVAGVGFNVPPAAIRMPVQRRPGAQERVDLAFLWPSLEPPDPAAQPAAPPSAPGPDGLPAVPHSIERIFVTIAAAGDTLAPIERVRTIYPRYLESAASAGPEGLAVLPFRPDSPYQGEDLIYETATPENFLVRCTRDGPGATPGTCLYERRIEQADVVVRFPRDWLADWHMIASKVDQLIVSIGPRR